MPQLYRGKFFPLVKGIMELCCKLQKNLSGFGKLHDDFE